MTVCIRSTNDVKVNGVKCAVYGSSGVGKTRLCATAPSPLIISTEKGLLSLAHDDIPYVEANNLEEIGEVYDWVANSDEAKKYETICIDSLSEICELLIAEFKPEFKDKRQAYMKLADKAAPLIRHFRDLDGKNIVFTCKMALRENEATGLWVYEPMLPGRVLPHGLPYLVDEVFCYQIAEVDGEQVRFLQTNTEANKPCKDRSGALDANEKPDLTYIFNKIKEYGNV